MLRVLPTGWGTSRPEDVAAVVRNCADHMLPLFGPNPPGEIWVAFDADGPNTNKVPDHDGHIIRLSSQDLRWAQLAYQFAHEYCHILMRHWRVPLVHRFRWFEESICEVSSLFFLRNMSKSWCANPPCANWSSYADNLGAYVDEQMKKVGPIPSQCELRDWLIPNLPRMMDDPNIRDLNNVVAARLLPLFEQSPSLWAATSKINLAPKLDGTLSDFFDSWESSMSESETAIIDPIRMLICGR